MHVQRRSLITLLTSVLKLPKQPKQKSFILSKLLYSARSIPDDLLGHIATNKLTSYGLSDVSISEFKEAQ